MGLTEVVAKGPDTVIELDLTEGAAAVLAGILAEQQERLRSLSSPPKGLTVADAYDRLRFCERVLEKIELYMPDAFGNTD